ncbi:MAG: hypothetical protein ABL930_03300 [Pseudobdellovibrio sp.]
MNNIVRLLGLGLFLLIFVSCDRAKEESSVVSIQLPTYSSNVSSLTCTKCLKAIFVNVDGQDIKKIVYSEKDPAGFQQAASEIKSEIVVEVPVGNARRFQVMAVYLESSGSIQVQYGVTTVDLQSSDPPPVQLQLQPLGVNSGQFRGGTIAGRYIAGFNSVLSEDYGPTGVVSISLVDPASGLEIQFEQGEIINGWFNFFASESFTMKYTLADGTVLFGGPVTLGSFTLSQNIAKLSRPNDYWVDRNGGWSSPEHVTEYHDIVYGFFGPAALVNTKKVCFQGEPSIFQFSKIAASSDGSSAITYSTSISSADVTPSGGLNSFANSSDCTTANVLSADRYESGAIYVNKNQLDGIGNDNAVSLSGAFTHRANASGDISKASFNSSADLTVKALPGLLSNLSTSMFDGIKVYKKDNAPNGGYDNLRCNPGSLGIEGFVEITGLTVSVATDTASVNLAGNIDSNDGIFICPTKTSALRGFGGIGLGAVNFAKLSIATVPAFSGVSTRIITITNSGTSNASGLGGTVSGANFTFNGGSYPGSSGTCGTSLTAGSSCTVDIAYSAGSTLTLTLTMSYNVVGSTVGFVTKTVSGTP